LSEGGVRPIFSHGCGLSNRKKQVKIWGENAGPVPKLGQYSKDFLTV